MRKLFTTALLLGFCSIAFAQSPSPKVKAIVENDDRQVTTTSDLTPSNARMGLPEATGKGSATFQRTPKNGLLLESPAPRRMYATVPMLVTTIADAGVGSLREAITAANAAPGDDYIITFSEDMVGKTISLSSALPVINGNISIIGPTAPNCNKRLRLSRNTSQAAFVILEASGGNIVIDNLGIENGNGTSGGVKVTDANITINNCEIFNCVGSSSSGGIRWIGLTAGTYSVAVKNCYLHDLTGAGSGGILISGNGVGVVTNSEISNTTITRTYGGLTGAIHIQQNGSASLHTSVVKNNTIHNNTHSGFANSPGIIFASFTGPITATVTNNTVTENKPTSAGGQGGGIWVASGTTAVLQNNLVQNNTGFLGNIYDGFSVAVSSAGGNISSDNSAAGFLTQPSDRHNTPIVYAPLTDYTLLCTPPYHLIKCNTLAFNGGTAGAGVPTTDQRGKTRTGLPDVGAVEADRVLQSSSAMPTPLLTAAKTIICKGENANISVGGCTGLVYWSNDVVGGSLQLNNLTQTTRLTANCADETSDACYIKVGSTSSPVTITVNEPATIPVAAVNNAMPCVLAPINLTAGNCNGTIRWSDGQNGNAISSFVVQQTNFVARCEVTGCATTYSNPVTVTPKNGVVVTASKTIACGGETVNLTATGCSGYVFWNSSKFGNTFSVTMPNPNNYADKVSVYAVCQTDPCPVPNRTVQEITVNQSPFVSLQANSPLAPGATMELRSLGNPTRNDLTYNWVGKNGFTSSVKNPTKPSIRSIDWGHYSVTIGDPMNNCSNTGNIFVWVQQSSSKISATNEDEFEGFEMNVYPNPVSNTLMVEVKLKTPSPLSLRMYDSVGKDAGTWALDEEKDAHFMEIDMRTFLGGMYYLQAKSNYGKQTKKVVKVQY